MFEDDFFQDQAKEETGRGATKKNPPPRNRQEWTSRNGMSQWPSDKELTGDSSNPLCLLEPGEPVDSLATLNEISEDLRRHSSKKFVRVWDTAPMFDTQYRLGRKIS